MTTSQVGCTLKDETVMGGGGLVGKKRKKTNGQGESVVYKKSQGTIDDPFQDGGRELTDAGSSKGSSRVMSL